MAIEIEWQVNPKLKDGEDGQQRLSPHVVNSEVVDGEKLAELMAKNSTYSRGTVINIIEDMAEKMVELLSEGKTIDIPSLGTFRISVGADAKVALSDATSARKVIVNGINFRPGKEARAAVSKASFRTVARNASIEVPSAESIVPALNAYFDTHDGISRVEFARIFNMKRSSALSRLKELLEMGVIKSTGNARETKYVKG